MSSGDAPQGPAFDPNGAERVRGLLLTLGAALLWSFGGLGIKVIDAGDVAIAGWRSFFAIPVLLVVLGPGRIVAGAPAALRSPRVWGAALAYALTLISFVTATRLTTAATAIALQYTGPIYVALLSGPLLGEKMRPVDWLALAGCLGGMLLFTQEELSPDDHAGIALALFSGVCFGALPLLLRLEFRAHPGMEAPLSPVLAILLGNVLTVLLTAWPMLSEPPRDGLSWAVAAALGVFQIGAAYLLYTAGVRRLRAVEAALVTTVEPVLNPVWVAMGTGEIPGFFTVLGGIVIVLSVSAQGILPALRRR
jgi:DME family drug/metabolite transporter